MSVWSIIYISNGNNINSKYGLNFNLSNFEHKAFYNVKKNRIEMHLSAKKNFSQVLNKKNIVLGILTADCASILFYDPIKTVIGACHAGWRGALTGIIDNTLIKMKNLGSIPKNIRCAIGPCIGKESYEVGKDFYDKFIATDISNCQFFEKKTQKNSKMKHLRVENSGLIAALLQPIESKGYGPKLTLGGIDLMD